MMFLKGDAIALLDKVEAKSLVGDDDDGAYKILQS
jgi:hypothetical protein